MWDPVFSEYLPTIIDRYFKTSKNDQRKFEGGNTAALKAFGEHFRFLDIYEYLVLIWMMICR